MKTVVVIGGGITGLSTMFYLEKLKKDYNIDLNLILVEKEEYLGGKIHSVEEKDFIMESGADSIVARNEHVIGEIVIVRPRLLRIEGHQRISA